MAGGAREKCLNTAVIELLRVPYAIIVLATFFLTATSRPGCDISAIYNFGDSNSDTGGAAAAFPPLVSPNGETFFQRPAGRLCDGRLIVDFYAEHLGIPYLSAYLNSNKPNFKHGVNFAVAGATLQHRPGLLNPFSLDVQVIHFDNFKTQTSHLYNQGHLQIQKLDTQNPCKEESESSLPRPGDFSKALYTFDIGQNDLYGNIAIMSKQQTLATIPDIINDFASAVQQLYGKGARAFWIHNTVPIGCLPSTAQNYPTPRGLDEYGCAQDHNDIAIEFNKQLKNRVTQLRLELPRAALTYVDMYAAKYKLITDAKNQGFEEPLKICCGYVNGTKIWCGKSENVNGTEIVNGSCQTPARVINWDSIHYTEAANHWIINQILNGSLSDPPISLAQACVTNALDTSF